MLRLAGLCFVVAVLAGTAACGPADIGLRYENRTDEVICEFTGPPHPVDRRCPDGVDEIPAHSTKRSGRDCDGLGGRKVDVFLTVKATGELIYGRTATCNEWADAGTIVIAERDGEFVVTDELDR